MSRQFRVYLLPSDANNLVNELKQHLEIKVVKDQSTTSEPVELISPVRNESMYFKGENASSIRCYFVPPDRAIVDMNFYENPDRWVIQPTSEAIEFSGCDFDGITLLVGRLYFQNDRLDNGAIVQKRESFIRWADAVFRHAKKSLHRHPQLDAYLGQGAQAFMQRNGKLAAFIKPNGDAVYVQE